MSASEEERSASIDLDYNYISDSNEEPEPEPEPVATPTKINTLSGKRKVPASPVKEEEIKTKPKRQRLESPKKEPLVVKPEPKKVRNDPKAEKPEPKPNVPHKTQKKVPGISKMVCKHCSLLCYHF
jgi:hypothetical protein